MYKYFKNNVRPTRRNFFACKTKKQMDYLNKEYKNLSDCDKKKILPSIIKYLQEEKQKIDDKINGKGNGKIFLEKLEIDTEEWEEQLDRQQVELKEELDNNNITQVEEGTRNSNDLNVDILCADNLNIHVSYHYCFDNNNHNAVFYKRHVNISQNGEDVAHYTKNGEWVYGPKDTPIPVPLQLKSFKLLNKILEIEQREIYKDFISYMH